MYRDRGSFLADKLSQSEIDAMLKGLEKPQKERIAGDGPQKQNMPVVEKVEFAPFKSTGRISGIQKKDISYFNQIPMIISGELGKAYLTVRDFLKLEEGSVIKLDRLAGESATIMVNGQPLGLAEIVVINDKFGLRVTAIGQTDQIKETPLEETAERERQDR